MNYYVGIDLGTTNSAICSYDGENVRLWKSPEQNDVTPSAIYLERRGNKYIGQRAYDNAPRNPGNAATLFKRFMGTSTPINFSAVDTVKTPEECSAEVLKALYGYLPEDIRNQEGVGAVITVPAAFNQMQKDATMQAAQMAGIGNVALMQEPVAAVMSVMRSRNKNGKFLIYDLGGGTFDIALAESTGGRVSLLSHGGIAMCGGRDIDRSLWENIVRPWLMENFELPEDLSVNNEYKVMVRLALWATEKAKIELSAREQSVVTLSESEVRIRDLKGNELYIEVPLCREDLNELIEEQINATVQETRSLLEKSGINSNDIDCIVFIGGPTNYKPLRDKVTSELALQADINVNPMTAVAEGASIFAESVDWSSSRHGRKSSRGQINSGGTLAVSFNYTSRTPDTRAKIATQVASKLDGGWEFQIDCVDTGWTSGRLPLKHGIIVDVTLGKKGENRFKASVYDPQGVSVPLEKDSILIVRTSGTVDSIPASHSVALEVLEKMGGTPMLQFLVKSGDALPKKGSVKLKARETLKAGSHNSFNFKLWEGEIQDRISDNRLIGVLKVSGSDFDDGVIPAGADLEFEYEVLDSGNIAVEVSVPCIGAAFNSSGKNFYSRQVGEKNFNESAPMIKEEGNDVLEQIDEVAGLVDDPKIEIARDKLESAISLAPDETDPERVKEAEERTLEAKKILAQVRNENRKTFRQNDLDKAVALFEEHVKRYAKPSEITEYNRNAQTAQKEIDTNGKSFEGILKELNRKSYAILWQQPWFIIGQFKRLAAAPHMFTDKTRFDELCRIGWQYLKTDEIEKLDNVIDGMFRIMRSSASVEDMNDLVNIIRG